MIKGRRSGEGLRSGAASFGDGGLGSHFVLNGFAGCSVQRALSVNRNSWILLVALVGLGALYARFFTDWFATPRIQVSATSRPGIGVREPGSALPIVFGLDRDYVLDQVRVLSLSSLQTNKAPVEVWNPCGKAAKVHSAPTRGFAYGAGIEGLPSGPAEPLVPGAPYRLEIASGRLQGSVDFIPRASE